MLPASMYICPEGRRHEIESRCRGLSTKEYNLHEGGTHPNDMGTADVVFCHDMAKKLLEAAVETLAPWTIFFFLELLGPFSSMDEKHISGRAKFVLVFEDGPSRPRLHVVYNFRVTAMDVLYE